MSAGRTRRCAVCRTPLATATTGRPRRYCSDRCRVSAWRQRQRRSVHFSSATDEWATPQAFFDALDAEFAFELDVCALPSSAKCARYFTPEVDGLAQQWRGVCWMNPPYGRAIGRWVAKAWEASQSGAEVVVCLLPARTDTAWWHEYVTRGEVRFLRGRLRFGGADTGAPFPSAVVVFRNPVTVTKRETTA